MSTAVMGIFALCVCLVCVVIAVAIYYSTQSEETPSTSPSPASASPSPASASPLQTLRASGQEIQKNELVISGATPPAVTTQPTGITATGSFTLSMDLNMTTLPGAGQWLGVFGQGAHPKSPGLWLAAAGLTTSWLRFHLGTSTQVEYPGTTPVPYNTYFNVTAVWDATAKKCTLYHNGVKIAENTATNLTGFNPPTPTNFEWNQQKVSAPTLKVRNVYWWNKALTATEVALLAPPSSGTSTYTSEPMKVSIEGYSLN